MIGAKTAADTVVRAIRKANRDYQDWSDGWWLSDSGGEALMLAQVARDLAKIHNGKTVVEMPVGWLGDGVPVGQRRRGPVPADLRKGGRCDIGLLDSQAETVHGIIELKRAQARSGWRSDLLRLGRAMDTFPKNMRHGHLRFAILGGFVSSSSRSNFAKKLNALDRLIEGVGDAVEKKGFRLEKSPDDLSSGLHRLEGSQWQCNAFAVGVLRKGAHWA